MTPRNPSVRRRPADADAGSASTSTGRFCLAKCPYCDFNSHVRAEPVDEERFVPPSRPRSPSRRAERGRVARSISFRRGTPSLMKPQTCRRLIDAVAARLAARRRRRGITLEANPTSGRGRGASVAIAPRRQTACRIGVQVARRTPTSRRSARVTAPPKIGGQTGRRSSRAPRSTSSTPPRPDRGGLERRLDPSDGDGRQHLSIYSSPSKPDTIFERLGGPATGDAGRRARPRAVRRDPGDLPRRTACRPTRSPTTPGRGRVRHNMVYWRYGEYVGVGPGAHGRILGRDGRRGQATGRHPEMWLAQVERKATA